ncbi:MAG: RagB/SusD family nutrient uptake outer membrane protein [Cyclobacteriaceae bacterium]
MKTSINKIGLALGVLGILVSCSSELELEPKSVITSSSFWNSEDDVNGVLNGMYYYFRVANKMTYQLGEGRSEIYRIGIGGSGAYDLFYNNTLNPSNLASAGNYSSGVDWKDYYTLINSANLLIKYVPDIDYPSEDNKKNALAQAYTMRAFTYFVMAKTWGAVPLRTEPTEGYTEGINVPRTPLAEVFNQIKSDLDQALVLFPDNSIPDGRNMWSKAGANALKADVYLWTGKMLNGGQADFTTALSACTAVEEADVELLPEFSDLFQYENKGSREVIMSIYFKLLENTGKFSYFRDLYMFAGLMPSGASQQARDFIGSNTGGGFPVWQITDLVKDQFTEDDKRRKASFYELYDHKENGDSVHFVTISQKGTGAVNSGGVREYVSDIIIYRLADVLLMKAEAKNALGQDPSEEINKVRMRAYGDNFAGHEYVNGTQAQNDEVILKERLLELVYEGKRWWDLIRFEKAFDIVPSLQDRKGQDYLLLFPISLNTLSLEPLVEQNPGY